MLGAMCNCNNVYKLLFTSTFVPVYIITQAPSYLV